MSTAPRNRRSPLARRVALYELALADDQRPNAFDLTPADIAGGRYDSLPSSEQWIAAQALRSVGVSL